MTAPGPTVAATTQAGSSRERPTVSVIIPCRNEGRFIGRCLQSVLRTGYPHDKLEVLVVDGMSDDQTRQVVQDAMRQHPFIRLLDNEKRATPFALNIGIRAAAGDVLIRLDAHTEYAEDYLETCVDTLEQYDADNVGGILKILPRDDSLLSRSIAASLAHPFGIGDAAFRYVRDGQPRWVDTVPFFCCRREVFERIGLFNEQLRRGQDMEFSQRLRKAGGRVLLNPRIVGYYYARTDPVVFVRHNWANGVWAVVPFAHSSTVPVAWRHLVPLAMAASILGSLVLGLLWRRLLWCSLAGLAAYGLASLGASTSVARRERDPRLLVAMPVAFALLHWPYGVGSLWGAVQLGGLLLQRWRQRWQA